MHCTIRYKSPSRQTPARMGASREGIVASPQSVGASCSGIRVLARRWSVQGQRAFRCYRVHFGRCPPLDRPISLVSPLRPTAVLMDADNGSVDHLDGAVMGFGEGLHDQVPDASHPPTNEPVVPGRVRSKALRQVAPWGAQYPEDAVEDTSVVDPKHAALLVRKERLTAIHSSP